MNPNTLPNERVVITQEVTPADAIYGFSAWLTTRDEAVQVGANHDSSVMATLAIEYCEAQGFGSVGPNYPYNLKPMRPEDG